MRSSVSMYEGLVTGGDAEGFLGAENIGLRAAGNSIRRPLKTSPCAEGGVPAAQLSSARYTVVVSVPQRGTNRSVAKSLGAPSYREIAFDFGPTSFGVAAT